MPHVIQGEPTSQGLTANITMTDYGYAYPEGLNLRPGSTLHEFLKKEILERARESRNQMEKRFTSWNGIDKTLTAYVKLSDVEKELKNKPTTSPSTKRPMSIVFPYSYAILETVLTYLILAFVQDPIFRYEGVSPEDTIGAILLEKVNDVHCNKTKVGLGIHTMCRDGLAYGLGVAAPMWRERWGHKTVKVPSQNIFMEEFERGVEETILFEGNALENVDPYLYFPDPEVPVHKVQDGGFVGWLDIDHYVGLLDEEYSDEDVFNVKFLKHLMGRHSIFAEKQSLRQEFAGGHRLERTDVSKRVDVLNMYINLIPEEWKLGKGERPEKWLFSLASDEVIIRAKPLGLNHNMYPIVVSAPEFDGYSPTPISRLEILSGLQEILDWELNVHIVNQAKAVNDMFVVDPYLVNMNDLKDPQPGKLVRMRRPAWGRGVKDAVTQLTVTDVTRGNIADTALIVQWMQKIGASDESMMGSLRQGGPERLTGKEFEGTRTGSVSRLERIARVIGLQAMQDIGYMFASHTQQLMSQEVFVKTTGRWQEDLIKEYGADVNRIKVSPFDVLIDYDVMVRDGSIPGGNFSSVWVKMWELMGKHPILQQEIDIFKVFVHIARNLGAKNVHDFKRIKTQTMPNEQVEEGARKGDLVPLSSIGG